MTNIKILMMMMMMMMMKKSVKNISDFSENPLTSVEAPSGKGGLRGGASRGPRSVPTQKLDLTSLETQGKCVHQQYLEDHPSKWLVTMVIVSPINRVVPLQNDLFMAYEWGLLTTY